MPNNFTPDSAGLQAILVSPEVGAVMKELGRHASSSGQSHRSPGRSSFSFNSRALSHNPPC
jgi:hypothetical protein